MSKVTSKSTPVTPKSPPSPAAELKKAEQAALAALQRAQAQADQDLAAVAKLAPAQKQAIGKIKTQVDGQYSSERSALESKFNAAIQDLEKLNPPSPGKGSKPTPEANKKPAPMSEATALKTLEKNFTSIKDEGKGPAGRNLINRADLQAAASNPKSSAPVKQAAEYLLANSKAFAATDVASRGGKADGLISIRDLQAEEAKLAKSSKGGKPATTGINDAKLPAQFRQWAPDILASSKKYGLSPAYVAAVMDRETGGVNERGDGGHGRGLMQIDDRSHGAWLASHDGGMDPKSNIDYGCSILKSNLDTAKGLGLKGDAALKFAASAYNAGVGGAEAGLRAGNSDANTTGHNYGSDVLNRMKRFESGFTAAPAKGTGGKKTTGAGKTHKAGGTSSDPNQAAFNAARSVLGKNIQGLKYSGPLAKYLDKWPSDTVCCANFVSACQQDAGLMTASMHTDSVANLSSELSSNKNWEKVSLRNAKPGDVVIFNVPGEGAYGHTVMFAGWKGGVAQFIGSNNVNADGSQRITEGPMGYGITAIYQHK